ncbi:Uncharacterized protein DBV15_12910, partial [Temnothorax longispinosus]
RGKQTPEKGARGRETRRNASLTRSPTENNRSPLAASYTPPEDQTDPPSVNGALMHTFHCAAPPARLDRSIVCRWIDTERNQSDRYIVGGLNISKSKIGRSVSDAGMHASERSGGRETTLVVFVPRWTCVLTFRARPRQIRCWNAGPLVGGHPMPAESPFPLLAAVSVAGAARIPELRTEIRFVRVPQRQPPCRSHRSHYLYW